MKIAVSTKFLLISGWVTPPTSCLIPTPIRSDYGSYHHWILPRSNVALLLSAAQKDMLQLLNAYYSAQEKYF